MSDWVSMETMALVYMAWAQPLSYIWIWFAIASHEGYEKTKVMFLDFLASHGWIREERE